MIAALDFIKQLPQGIELDQRIAVEGLVLASTIIDAELAAIYDAVGNIEVNGDNLSVSDPVRLNIFRAAWAMIDRLDFIRQLLHSNEQLIGFQLTAEQRACLTAAQNMRNGMDHPHGTIQKLKKARKHEPIFGLFLFAYVPTGSREEKGDGTVLVAKRCMGILTLSSAHLNFGGSFASVLGDQIDFPFGQFELHAFGQQLPFKWAKTLSTDLQAHIGNVVAPRLVLRDDDPTRKVQGPMEGTIAETFHEPVTVRLSRP